MLMNRARVGRVCRHGNAQALQATAAALVAVDKGLLAMQESNFGV
ncbi:MAG: hypothetical protein ABIW85_11315 [Variovorax sp.]